MTEFRQIVRWGIPGWIALMVFLALMGMALGVAEVLSALEVFDEESIEQALRTLAQQQGLGAAKLIHPTRLAISGLSAGPGLFELVAVLGKETVVRRIENAAALIESGTFDLQA